MSWSRYINLLGMFLSTSELQQIFEKPIQRSLPNFDLMVLNGITTPKLQYPK